MKDKHCSCLKMSDKTLLKKVKAQMKSQFGKKARLSKVNKKCILCLCPYNQMMDIKNKKNASKKTVSKKPEVGKIIKIRERIEIQEKLIAFIEEGPEIVVL